MAILLSCRELSKAFGPRPLFEGLSFGLFEGERTGLIGPNGTGKSTLLRILAGLETPDSGELAPRRGLRVGYLAQRDRVEDLPAGTTVKAHLSAALAGLGLQDYEIETRVAAGMDRAGFDEPEKEAAQLSGGWRKRLAILAETLREPDLLLLDEPTNHLDLEGVLWLERFLDGLKFSFLVVTHDRRFLERVCNRLIELDRRYPQGHLSSAGNYSKFLENREIFLDAQASREDSLRNIVRGEIEWLRKGPKARTTKQKARIDRAGRLIGDLSELEYRNAQGRATVINFLAGDRQANRLIHAVKIEKSLGGRKLFGLKEKDLNLAVAKELYELLKGEELFDVMMTRSTDEFVPLSDRSVIANNFKADIFVSVHANANRDRREKGFEIYFMSEKASDPWAAEVADYENSVVGLEDGGGQGDPAAMLLHSMARNEYLNEGGRLAGLVTAEMEKRTPFANRGVKQAAFYVLRGTYAPGILVEMGFMTNSGDQKNMNDKKVRAKIANAIYKGIMKYAEMRQWK